MLEVVVSGLSLLVLFGFTVYFVVDAATMISEDPADDDSDVRPLVSQLVYSCAVIVRR